MGYTSATLSQQQNIKFYLQNFYYYYYSSACDIFTIANFLCFYFFRIEEESM
jgi:hypothetical protein